MKIMVTGGRDWRNLIVIRDALYQFDTAHDPPTLIHGCASGADAIARAWAEWRGWEIEDYWPNYAKWDFARANKERNLDMIEQEPDVVLAFPTQRSRGTWHAVGLAKERGWVEGETLFIYDE